jgi:hypothetical protein
MYLYMSLQLHYSGVESTISAIWVAAPTEAFTKAVAVSGEVLVAHPFTSNIQLSLGVQRLQDPQG